MRHFEVEKNTIIAKYTNSSILKVIILLPIADAGNNLEF